jgi:hypothetical protein
MNTSIRHHSRTASGPALTADPIKPSPIALRSRRHAGWWYRSTVWLTLLIGWPSGLTAQIDPGIHRLTPRDATVLARYLPVLVRGRLAVDAVYSADVALIEALPAWRDSVLAGTLDLAALVRRRFGSVTLPPALTLDVRCSMERPDPVYGVTLLYFSREPLPDAGLAKRGTLTVLGEETQRAVALADRNVPIAAGWEAFLARNGYVKTFRDPITYYLRIMQGDTLTLEVRENSGCVSDDRRRVEPTVALLVPFRELRAGRRVAAADAPPSIDGMLAADQLTEDQLTALVSAALVARADLTKGKPSDQIPPAFVTPEMRANFAVREANMEWLRKHEAVLGAGLARYDALAR